MQLTNQLEPPEITLVDRYLQAQLSGDRRAALALVDWALDLGLSARQVVLEIIAEAQHEIGQRWQESRLSIAQEHLATAISQLALAHVFNRAVRKPARGRKVIVACVERELHDFPARIVGDLLDLDGFDVRFLGANVPTESLIGMVRLERPDLVALSVTMSFHLGALRLAVQALRANFPQLPIAVGGRATAWARSAGRELGVDIAGAEGDDVLIVARRLLGVGENQP